jgi:hypothetical protein
MGYTDYLTREERIQRIGQLLSKGITLMLLREAEEIRVAERQTPTGAVDQPALDSQSPSAGDKVDRLDDDECKILAYIQRVRAASPRDMQRYLEISKATLYGKLRHLIDAKLVSASGKTTAIRYRWFGVGDRYA